MFRCNLILRSAVLGFGLALVAAAMAFGDSLLLKDGRLISGQVTHTESGYVIRTRTGQQTFAESDVQHWTHSESADSDPSPKVPAVTAPAAPGAPAKAVTPGAAGGGAVKTSQQKSVAKLVERGNTALAAGDFIAARGAFADALLLDVHNTAAAQGIGYAFLRLTPPNYVKARDALEIAYPALPKPPRSLACDLSLALAQTRNPMRSAKVLKEYLTAHPEPIDEPALNALAAALFQADELTRHNSFYAQVVKFYDDYNKKLEATRPGEKRWGTSWLPAEEADLKLKTYLEKRDMIAEMTNRIAYDQGVYNSASEEATVQARSGHDGSAARIAVLNQQMKAAEADATKAQADLTKAKEGFEFPPIDATLAVVEPEAVTAIASAAPVGTDPTPASGTDLTAQPDPVASADSTGSPLRAGHVRPPPAGAPAVIAARALDSAPRRRLHIESNAVAFPVGPDLVVTTAEAVNDASDIKLQVPSADTLTAEVVSKDDASGLALLRVSGKRMAYMPLADAFTTGPVTCISFPDVNLFDPIAAAITGTVGSVTGTAGKYVVSLSRSPHLGGGPLLANGKVVGVQLADRDSDQHAIAVATLDDLKKLVSAAGPPAAAPAGFDAKSITMQLTAIKENR